MERIILHCDLNCFFASVEMLSHPEARDVPMAVCGDPASRHGIILAKNEHAKKLGIVTAETVWQAKKKAPGLVLLPPHHKLYEEYSRRVNAIYGQYTDLVEPFGIDESWLDITGSAHLFGGDGKAIADEIRARVRQELGLTLSVGVSFNKIFAKLGSDYKKPDATTVISRDNWRQLVFPLPVGDLLFVGKAAQKVLTQYGIDTIGELAACRREMLETLLGKLGGQLYEYANGLEHAPVRPQGERDAVKSVGNGMTFPRDLVRWDDFKTAAALLSDSVAMRLRQENLCCGGVHVLLRTADFKNISRQKQLTAPTHLMRDISNAALELIRAAWKAPTPVRMVTITAIYLSPEGESYGQLDLLGKQPSPKQEQLESAMDAIRGKFGADAIAFGTPADDLKGRRKG
jgi:DNA polymerase-4